MATTKSTVRASYIELRGIYLGADFLAQHRLESGKKYPISVEGLPDTDLRGTLDNSSFIGGLAKLYRAFDLVQGDLLEIDFRDGRILITPPPAKKREGLKPAPEQVGAVAVESVFARQRLKHLSIERYSPGNLSVWEPQTEADVYMVFGALAEVHDYHYCCGASRELLDRLGYKALTKPDAIVIDAATDEYLMAEFKIRSSQFKSNHKPEDVDLLVCWIHDERDESLLPPSTLELSSRLRKAIDDGDIDL